MVNQQDARLVLAAASLARTAPSSWNEFLAALSELAAHERLSIITSPIDRLPVVQGRAQMSHVLLSLLHDCVKQADLIQKAQEKVK